MLLLDGLEYILSVDPGTHSGWALWARGMGSTWLLWRVGRLEDPTTLDVWELLGRLLPSWVRAHGVFEGQWFREKHHRGQKDKARGQQFSKWSDVRRLVEIRCTWQVCTEIAGASSIVVDPGTWIRRFSANAPGDTPAERVSFVTSQLFRGLELTADESAAVGLGVWWLREQRQTIDFRHMPERGVRIDEQAGASD